jgi:hypothetical protein
MLIAFNNYIIILYYLLITLFQSDCLLGGRTALHLAASRGDLAAVTQLLAPERKESSDGSTGVDINQTDPQGWTALHCACEGGHLEVCDALLQSGADPSIPTNDGNLALHYVASRPPAGQKQARLYAEAEDRGTNGNHNGDDEEVRSPQKDFYQMIGKIVWIEFRYLFIWLGRVGAVRTITR